MLWSNDALHYEKKWYKEIKKVLQELEKEGADKFMNLKVDENGVLLEIPKEDVLFDRTEAVKKLGMVGKKLMKETLQYFGEKAIKETNAQTT